MWSNADDQGRLCGDPEEIKYTCCPNIDDIAKKDIPGILEEFENNELIKAYDTPKSTAIQLLDWWEVHRPQWARPSEYPPPEGWQDHLRYKKSAREVITQNWPVSGESQNGTQVSENNASPESENSAQVSENSGSGEPSGEPLELFPLTTPSEKEYGIRNTEEEEGNSPESQNGTQVSKKIVSPEKPSPSPTGDIIKNFTEILSVLTFCFRNEWGRVPARTPYTVIPREPEPRESAQLRDFAEELSAAGGVSGDFIKKAFDEAATHGKKHISYARAVLLDWLGIDKGPPGEERRAIRRKRAKVPK